MPQGSAETATHGEWYKKLHWQILAAMVVAVPVGLLGGKAAADGLDWLGQLFLRLLRMVVVPLILFSIASGVASIGSLRGVGRIGAKTVAYYIVTSAAAICVGLVLANFIHPGHPGLLGSAASVEHAGAAKLSLGDILFRLVPENPVEAMVYSGDDPRRGPNILGIIFFAILFGAASLALEPERRKWLTDAFDNMFAAMMKLTGWVVRLAPLGVFALLVGVVGKTGFSAFSSLALYMLTVFCGLTFHAFVTLPLVLRFVGRRKPASYAGRMAPALAMAFSSASSNATLPLTMECAEERAGVPNRVTSFVLPLGATVNMDGTALYECVAALFIAQCYGVELGLVQQLTVMLTALLASIGAAGIPHAGLVMMSIVLGAVGLPLEGIGMILAVDRILDMCRTTVNVWSDSVGAATVARLEGLAPDLQGGDGSKGA
ncbi:MAG: dicarboxylate/amino acid:cation symporter [Deltaproteobacteria bacterium]|nr:MAG: dicarboxylate/amino acid:cation symporter [Deltaproteobacteria bacterium]